MNLSFTPPTLEDCVELMKNLRPGDEAEVLASWGHLMPAHLWVGCARAHEAFTVRDHMGNLVCLFGVGKGKEEGVGVPWLLGTKHLDRRLLSLCKIARERIKEWHKVFPYLINMTDQRNTRILLWLRWLGFRLGDEILVGPDRTPFILFSRHSRV